MISAEQVREHRGRYEIHVDRRRDVRGLQRAEHADAIDRRRVVDQAHAGRPRRGDGLERRAQCVGQRSDVRKIAADETIAAVRHPPGRRSRDTDDMPLVREELGDERIPQATRRAGDDGDPHQHPLTIKLTRMERAAREREGAQRAPR